MSRCIDCKHWSTPRVIVGSRRVAGICSEHEDGFRYAGHTCNLFAQSSRDKGALLARLSDQNDAINTRYPNEPDRLFVLEVKP